MRTLPEGIALRERRVVVFVEELARVVVLLAFLATRAIQKNTIRF
jgi:hypothetical protein